MAKAEKLFPITVLLAPIHMVCTKKELHSLAQYQAKGLKSEFNKNNLTDFSMTSTCIK